MQKGYISSKEFIESLKNVKEEDYTEIDKNLDTMSQGAFEMLDALQKEDNSKFTSCMM